MGGTEIYLNIFDVKLPSKKNKIQEDDGDQLIKDDAEKQFMIYLA